MANFNDYKEEYAVQEFGLPTLKRYPIIAGALAGVSLRLIFSGEAGTSWSAMTGAFIFFTPIIVGMLTVYLAERQKPRGWDYYVRAPFMATALFVGGTLLMFIEGWICAIIIIPMFAVLGAIGGLIMGVICRLTSWPKSTLGSLAAMPLAIAILGPIIPTPSENGTIERSISVLAPPAIVWQTITDIKDISEEEMADAWARKIGVPMPMSGTTHQTTNKKEYVRVSKWGKHVYFEEVMQDWQPEHYMCWTYRFFDDSFPRKALDDHVVIGGHYFDLLETEFLLKPIDEGRATQVTTRVRYRISTQFNFYANWVAQLLIGNLNAVGLRLYKSRSEQTVAELGVPEMHQ
jgi:hypothetical protein